MVRVGSHSYLYNSSLISGVRPPSDWSGLWPEEDASTEHSLYLDTQPAPSPATGPGSQHTRTQHSALGSGIQAGGNNGHNHTFVDF